MPSDIEFLQSAEWRSLSAEAKVKRYYAALGLSSVNTSRRAREILEKHHRHTWERFQEIVSRREAGNCSEDVYAAKNSDLQFSLLVGAAERGELHARLLCRLDEEVSTAASLLDVGCENGFVACFCALRFPNARVLGIDLSSEAIERARELAARLRLTNIEFVVASAAAIAATVGAQKFDVILSITLLHDAGMLPRRSDSSVLSSYHFRPQTSVEPTEGIRSIGSVLDDAGSRWIAAERCRDADTFWRWCCAVEAVGLGIDWQSSTRLEAGPDGGRLTVLVASPDAPRPLDHHQAQGLWLSPEFESKGSKKPWLVEGALADALLLQLAPKICTDRITAKHRDGGEFRCIEVWVSGPFAIHYSAAINEKSKLQILPVSNLPAMRDHWREGANALKKGAPDYLIFDESCRETSST